MPCYDPWELRLAWQIAWQVRGCPPEVILLANDGATDEEMQRHLAQCPFCRDLRDHTTSYAPWGELSERLSGPPDAASCMPEPAPGQLRALRPSLARWGPKDRYYNPPLVLVLSISEAVPEAVRVAQVYGDLHLSGPGDISLTDEFFAEAWNTYTVGKADLAHCLAEMGEAVSQQVRAASMAALTATPEEFSHLMAFRRLEIEVGTFFSSMAVAKILLTREDPSLRRTLEQFPTRELLIDHLQATYPQVSIPDGLQTMIEILALAQLPAGELPMAAAADETRIAFNRVVFTRDGLMLEAGSARISVWQQEPQRLLIGGKIEGTVPAGAHLLAWWAEGGEQLEPPQEVDFSPAEGFFRLVFADRKDQERDQGRLVLLLYAIES